MKLNLLLLRSRVVLDVWIDANRKLDTVAFELLAVGNRPHRDRVPVQDVDLLEG